MQVETSENLRNFAFRLGSAATRAGLSQVEIATGLGIKGPRVNNWFQARNFPRPKERVALARLLGVETDWLIQGIGEPQNKSDYLGVAETSKPYMEAVPPDVIRESLRAEIDAILSAAGDNRDRLGWVRVQLDQMSAVSRSWLSLEEVNRRATERAKEMTAAAQERRRLLDADHARRSRQSA